VTASTAGAGFNGSILLQLLDHKRRHPRPTGSYFPEADGQACPADGGELADFLAKHPEDGMPYGFPALKPQEFELLAGWLAQGAPGPTAAEQAALEAPSPQAAVEIGKWEAFLNRDDPKRAVTPLPLRAPLPGAPHAPHAGPGVLRAGPLPHAARRPHRPRRDRPPL